MSEPPLDFNATGQGPTVVLVHGAAPATTWGEVPARLASDHCVVTYARRGFPPNDGLPLAGSLREHTNDLEAILRTVGPSVVVGWSSGGVIALDLCLQHPELVAGAVVLEAPLHAKRHPSFGQLRAIVAALIAGRRHPEAGARRFLEWALRRTDGRPTDLHRIDPADLAAAAEPILHELRHATGEREIDGARLANLSVEVRWLLGDASNGTAESCARRAAHRTRNIEITTVVGAGHAVALDAPEAIEDAVDAIETRARAQQPADDASGFRT